MSEKKKKNSDCDNNLVTESGFSSEKEDLSSHTLQKNDKNHDSDQVSSDDDFSRKTQNEKKDKNFTIISDPEISSNDDLDIFSTQKEKLSVDLEVLSDEKIVPPDNDISNQRQKIIKKRRNKVAPHTHQLKVCAKSAQKTNNSDDLPVGVSDKSLNESLEVSGLSSLENSFVNINLKSVGNALRNKSNEVLICSNKGCKKNACFYCIKKRIEENNKTINALYTNLPEHYVSKHSKENLVSKLIKLQKMKEKLQKEQESNASKSSSVIVQEILKKRKKIFDSIRIKANHLNNLHAEDGSQYVVRRRPSKSGKTVAGSLPCFKCTQVFSENSLRKHVKTCTGLSFKKKHVIKSKARQTNGDYHEIASESAIKIISKMRETDAVKEIRYDKTVFIWLNAEASRTETKTYQHTKIRASLSRLGTLLKEIKKLNDNIVELSDVFNEDYYDNFIEAVKIMGKPNPDTKFMQSPATANDMFNLIKHVYQLYEVKLGPKEEEKRKLVQRFHVILKTMWHYSLGSTIAETQGRVQRNVDIELPSDSDNILLNKHLLEEMSQSFKNLNEEYSDSEYERLRNSLLCYMQSTNARRPGECERLELDDHEHTKTVGAHCLIIPRGKRRRGVPVVFDINIKRYLDLLVSLRSMAGIFKKNPFIFATIHDVTDNDFGFVSACEIMKAFAINCQASKPETLQGTRIRMKVATEGMKKGLVESEVQNLADYLGHTPRIHKQNYRQSVFDVDVRVSKQIRVAQGLDNGLNITEEQLYDSLSENIMLDQELSTMETDSLKGTASRSLPKTSRIRKTINSNTVSSAASTSKKLSRPNKLAWRKPSVDALSAYFPNALNLQFKVPSAKQIIHFLKTTKDPDLQLRTEAQVRSYIHTQRNQLKGAFALPERDHIPGYIYSCFKEYIGTGKIPSHKRCVKFLANSPSKSNITISNIQNWVELAIKKRASNKNIKT